MITRYNRPFKTNVIADAAFGSHELPLLCKEKGLGIVCITIFSPFS